MTDYCAVELGSAVQMPLHLMSAIGSKASPNGQISVIFLNLTKTEIPSSAHKEPSCPVRFNGRLQTRKMSLEATEFGALADQQFLHATYLLRPKQTQKPPRYSTRAPPQKKTPGR